MFPQLNLVRSAAITAVIVLTLKPVSAPADESGPKPGDVYREYSTHNGGGGDWRVTDPKAKNPGAKKFLPNPVLSIRIDDPRDAIRAEALLDRWGGHTGTTPKQIRFSGNDWITLPELATTPRGRRPEMYYSQDNPVVEIPLKHLKPGENTFEGTCGGSSWGQWGLYSLILRVYYKPDSTSHGTGRIVVPTNGATVAENPTIKLECSDNVGKVDLIAWYDGYDEDGDGIFLDWHQNYHQPSRGAAAELQNHVGTLRKAPFAARWNTRFVPDQEPGSIKLLARIQDTSGFWHVTEPVSDLTLERKEHSVKLYRASNVPERFGVRTDETKSCIISVPPPADLAHATEAGLHLRTWHGWDGSHSPLRLNGYKHPVEGKNHHYDYDLLAIPTTELKSGDNKFMIHSKTDHHMLEILWPGPALSVRYAK